MNILFLARRAIVGAAIADRHALDHAWTDPARLSVPVINSQVILKFPRFIIRVAIVGKRRATPTNGVMEQPRNRIRERLRLAARQSMRARRRLYPRERKDFVGVNIAKTGDDLLIE